jgi:hypothetical protein
MAILDRLLQRFAGKALDKLVQVRVAEAYGPASALDEDDSLYRRLTGNPRRDLTPIKHTRMIEIANYLYRSNPLAAWILETTRDFIVGEGVTLRSEDDAAQEVLTRFWDDPINRMPWKLPKKVLELGLFGEQCWPVFVDRRTGLCRLANVDPAMIAEVVHDPDNAEEPIGIILKDSTGGPGKKLRVLKQGPDEELFAAQAYQLRQEEFIDGECFWYTINSVSLATRGISDLYRLTDWADGYEQLIFNTLDRTSFMNAFTWDVSLKGLSQAQIDDWKKRNPPPKPGSLFAHNENVTLQAVAPDLQSEDTERHARVFRNHVLGSAGIPEHWFGGGGDINRATAAEMGLPTFKRFQARQLLIKCILEDVARYQLTQAGMSEAEFEVVMPRMVISDVTRAAAALQQVASASSVAQAQGWVDGMGAARLFAAAAALIGVDLPVLDNAEPMPREYRNG